MTGGGASVTVDRHGRAGHKQRQPQKVVALLAGVHALRVFLLDVGNFVGHHRGKSIGAGEAGEQAAVHPEHSPRGNKSVEAFIGKHQRQHLQGAVWRLFLARQLVLRLPQLEAQRPAARQSGGRWCDGQSR